MHIQFFGAAREVTGPMHLLTVDNKRILLDCGLFQGHRQEAHERNSRIPFDPASIDAVIVSHAHIDHSGNIPQLVKQGYEGNIFCTHATQDLLSVMLRDSAHIQESDTKFVNKIHKRKGLPAVHPLYTMEDAEQSMNHIVGIGYHRPFQVTPDLRVTFMDAGHILGSAVVILDTEKNGEPFRIVFTGDLGRAGLPVIRDPEVAGETDVFITESTYGNRTHDAVANMKSELKRIINATVARRGKIIVPAFSVGRTQELVYFLHQLFDEKAIPEIPIYVDSPLSVNITEVFRLHPECYDKETRDAFLTNHEDPFGFYRLRYIRHVEESKKLNTLDEPAIIISASGMCEAGRILHHLANNIPDPKNTVLIVGFMAENTLGRRLVEKHREVKIFGDTVPLRASVEIMNGFSAHADRNELLQYFDNENSERLKQVFVVHGEAEQAQSLADAIREKSGARIDVPERLQKFEL